MMRRFVGALGGVDVSDDLHNCPAVNHTGGTIVQIMGTSTPPSAPTNLRIIR